MRGLALFGVLLCAAAACALAQLGPVWEDPDHDLGEDIRQCAAHEIKPGTAEYKECVAIARAQVARCVRSTAPSRQKMFCQLSLVQLYCCHASTLSC